MTLRTTRYHGTFAENSTRAKARVGFFDVIIREKYTILGVLLLAFLLFKPIPLSIQLGKISQLLTWGYLIVAFILGAVIIINISMKMTPYIKNIRRLGNIVMRQSEKELQNPILLGRDVVETPLELPNYYIGQDLSIMRQFYEKNKNSRDLQFIILYNNGNVDEYRRCFAQFFQPIDTTDVVKLAKVMKKLGDMSSEDRREKPYIYILIENIDILEPYYQNVKKIIDGYENGIRIMYAGSKPIGDNNLSLLSFDSTKHSLKSMPLEFKS